MAGVEHPQLEEDWGKGHREDAERTEILHPQQPDGRSRQGDSDVA